MTNEFASARVLYRGALFAVALVVLVLLGLQLKWVVLQVFAAVIVAAGMAPIVSRVADPRHVHPGHWHPPAALVVVVIYIVVGALVLVLGTVLLRAVAEQLRVLISEAPDYAVELQSWYGDLAQRFPLLNEFDPTTLYGGTTGLAQTLAGLGGQALNVATLLLAVFGGVINVIFVLFMALYLTIGGLSMRDYLIVFLPLSRQQQARRVVTNISLRLGHWVGGQITLSVIVGVGAGIGLGVIGVPGASLLAVVWAVAEFIPGIGPFISAVPSIVLGFLAGPSTGLLAAIFTLCWSQVESNIITPRVMGRAVELNPLVVLVALLVGNELLGLAGALFSIPAAAVIAVIVDELRQERLAHLQEEIALAPSVPLA
ncbi:MAG: AI-2E family transporter [Chloroflexi bacterium]|nr:AI-2E family transporter [Chloroflexota bacterium]